MEYRFFHGGRGGVCAHGHPFLNFLHIFADNEEVFLFSILVLYTSLNLQLISVGVLVSVLIVLIPQYCYGRDDC